MKDFIHEAPDRGDTFSLEHYIGFRLRLAIQRYNEIFSRQLSKLTPPQFAALVKLLERGPVSQNEMGRQISVDAATTKGIVDRLEARGLVARTRCARDQRKINVALTGEGENLVKHKIPEAEAVASDTMSRLTQIERERLVELLAKL